MTLDLENRWIGEDIDRNGDGVVDHETRFVYDGNQIIFQFDKDGAGEVTSADLSHRYLWGPAVDQVLADEQLSPLPPGEGQGEGFDLTTPGNVVWPLADSLGTVRDLAVYDAQTATTTVANHRVYDSYGNLISETNAAVDCLFGFTGRPFDAATGLQNNVNRWYDSLVGRWASEDPIGLTAGDPNCYRYVANSSVNKTDPSGLTSISWSLDEFFRGVEKARRIEVLRQAVADAEAYFLDLKKRYAMASFDLSRRRARIDTLDYQCGKLQLRLTALERDLNDLPLGADAGKIVAEIAELQDKINELQDEADALEATLPAMEQHVKSLETETYYWRDQGIPALKRELANALSTAKRRRFDADP